MYKLCTTQGTLLQRENIQQNHELLLSRVTLKSLIAFNMCSIWYVYSVLIWSSTCLVDMTHIFKLWIQFLIWFRFIKFRHTTFSITSNQTFTQTSDFQRGRQGEDSIKSYPSLLILFFKTNINPTEYDPGAFKSMNAWIPALSTAFQHSIQNLFFFLFLIFRVEIHGLSALSYSLLLSYLFLSCASLCEWVSQQY